MRPCGIDIRDVRSDDALQATPAGSKRRGPRRPGWIDLAGSVLLVLALVCGVVTWRYIESSRSTGTTVRGASVSGKLMPTGDIPGWHQVYANDFAAGLGKDAIAYSGTPGGNPAGTWAPSHVLVHGGELVLRGNKQPSGYEAGGVGIYGAAGQKYGKYEVRFRAQKSDGYKYAFLLWPTDESWPPEIDFAEDGGGPRSQTTATLHYGADNTKIVRTLDADFSKWHTIGVEWTPGKLAYTFDGRVWATVTSAHVPDIPLRLAVQEEATACGGPDSTCPDQSTPGNTDIDIDWIVAYSPVGGQ